MKTRTLLGRKGYTPIIFTSPNIGNISPRKARELEMREMMPPGSFRDSQLAYLRDVVRPQVLETARQVVQGRFGKDQVQEVENGFRIIDMKLVNDLRVHLKEDKKTADNARITILKDLHNLGFRVGLLTPDPMQDEFLGPGFLYAAQKAGVDKKDIIYINNTEEMSEVSISFLRDGFTQIGDTVFLSDETRHLSWNTLKKTFPGLNWEWSRLGFGGEFVVGGGFAFMSNMSREQMKMVPHQLDMNMYNAHIAAKDQAKKKLEKMGKQVFTLPAIWTDILPPSIMKEIGTDKRLFMMMDHPDFMVLYPYIDKALFFDRSYYRENKDLLRKILDIIKPKHFATLPDEDGLPLNSLRLPFGGIYMDAAAEKSQKIIRDKGVRVETSSVPFGSFMWGLQGGINCSTNILWVKEQQSRG